MSKEKKGHFLPCGCYMLDGLVRVRVEGCKIKHKVSPRMLWVAPRGQWLAP